jgi:hypothetical protein
VKEPALNVRLALSLGLCLLGVAGCGPSAPYKTVPVSGTVTYDDGSPIKAHRVRVQFLPQVQPINPKEYPRPGSAEVKPDGTFANVTTWKYADGVIPGPNKVMVQALDEREKMTGAVDQIYGGAKTPITIEIKAGMGPIPIQVPKPGQAPAK